MALDPVGAALIPVEVLCMLREVLASGTDRGGLLGAAFACRSCYRHGPGRIRTCDQPVMSRPL
jgi:hypothetical protein